MSKYHSWKETEVFLVDSAFFPFPFRLFVEFAFMMIMKTVTMTVLIKKEKIREFIEIYALLEEIFRE